MRLRHARRDESEDVVEPVVGDCLRRDDSRYLRGVLDGPKPLDPVRDRHDLSREPRAGLFDDAIGRRRFHRDARYVGLGRHRECPDPGIALAHHHPPRSAVRSEFAGLPISAIRENEGLGRCDIQQRVRLVVPDVIEGAQVRHVRDIANDHRATLRVRPAASRIASSLMIRCTQVGIPPSGTCLEGILRLGSKSGS